MIGFTGRAMMLMAEGFSSEFAWLCAAEDMGVLSWVGGWFAANGGERRWLAD